MQAFRPAARAALKGCTTIAILLAAVHAEATSLFDPSLRFRQLPTEHFVVYFHQGEERTAARLAVIAEETWHALERPLDTRPPAMTRVVLVDQTEAFNGYATPLPYDTIVIFATWPPGAAFDVNDWLRLAFTHEFTHIVHLDRSEGWARGLRRIFGRMSFAFPNMYLPIWQIEGLATYEESAITGEGRLHAGEFAAIVDQAARARRLEPIDRVNGGLTDWPNGQAAYAYGLGFHHYLADRFGTASLASLSQSTARQLPYFGQRAFRDVFGRSLGDLWRDYESSLGSAPVTADQPAVTRLTHHGFSVSAPRFDRPACAGCPAQVVYLVADPRGFPGLYSIAINEASPRRLARRYFGGGTAPAGDAIYFDQLELRRNVSVFSDLYRYSRRNGSVRAITEGSRLQDPDIAADGGTIAAVRSRPGGRDLVLVRNLSESMDIERDVETLISEPETQFNGPRFSPDGRSIAVERHRPGSRSEVVIVDIATKAVRAVAADPDARIVTPAWRPDGGGLVVAHAPRDQVFNLREYAVDGSSWRQLTTVSGGAVSPDISPDGATLVFVGYTADGNDLFTMPYPQALGGRGSGLEPPIAATGPGIQAQAPSLARSASSPQPPAPGPQKYSPLATLRPTSWTPIVEGDSDQLRVGASLFGVDVLGYHAYAASATWRVAEPQGVPAPGRSRPDWLVTYAYARWRPTVFVSVSEDTSFFTGTPSDDGTPAASTVRERDFDAGVLFPFRRVRVSHRGLIALVHAVDEYTMPTEVVSRDRTALRTAWETASARTYGYSVSAEDGVALGATAEFVRRGLGAFADATTVTADLRAYLPGLARNHVVAVRAAGGTSTGEPGAARTFLLGGPGPDTLLNDFGSRAVTLLRGFGSNAFAARHVGLLNVDYRFPVVRPQRGVGTWPAFLHTVHGAVFVDAGEAWASAFDAASLKTSVGAELSARIVAGYSFPFTATVGAAWGHDRSGSVSDRATIYFRIGRAF